MTKSKTVTITFTLKEAAAVYKYLAWAEDVQGMSNSGLCCWAKRKATQQAERFGQCAVENCSWRSSVRSGAVKTSAQRASGKLHYALLGEPIITPHPDGTNAEIHEYPDALIPEADLYPFLTPEKISGGGQR